MIKKIKVIAVSFLMLTMLVFTFCKMQANSEHIDANSQSQHPSLILTEQVEDIKANLGSFPIFDKSLASTQSEIAVEILWGYIRS